MKEILKIVIINLVLFSILILTHEISHAVTGYFLGCNQIKIAFLDLANGPHTDLVCSAKSMSSVIGISGLVTNLLLSSVFLFSRFTKSAFFLTFGFSLILGSLDLSAVSGLNSVFFISNALGIGLITAGEYLTTSLNSNQALAIHSSKSL